MQHQRTLQPPHLFLRPMNQNNIPRFDFRDEISILDEIDMRRKTDVIHQAIQGLTSTFKSDHLFGLGHDFFG